MIQAKSIYIFSNGNVAAFDDKAEQVTALQKPWMQILLEYWERAGLDITKVDQILAQSGGFFTSITAEKSEERWNWEMKIKTSNTSL